MADRRISSTTKESPHVIPATMKAAVVDRFGPPSALTLHELPVPRPGPHEVVIAIDTAPPLGPKGQDGFDASTAAYVQRIGVADRPHNGAEGCLAEGAGVRHSHDSGLHQPCGRRLSASRRRELERAKRILQRRRQSAG